ncbi:uncharacterized protein VICG_01148 [Vittaforma corneae ATCC 50505]|uniref:Nudix hydrolase domain-containing protein n=1 Tax=Vittaforma corneae (strain ATCC 50505) TaxID=993615 RepID=L2GLS3_VITCO|nr:uncharacterized protein VICG_01148 [Vittaforma corneae ATCC 50505]ELA41796.1 hypothetical protein VICG_01148 [Vittaforma corneae ATCC 50505]
MPNENDEDKRTIVGAIPILDDQKILFVKSRHENWIFPKGGVKKSEKSYDAATREAFEEGGVIGQVELEPFCVKKGVSFYVLSVATILDSYPESQERQRTIMKMMDALENTEVAEYVREIVKEYIRKRIVEHTDDFLGFLDIL